MSLLAINSKGQLLESSAARSFDRMEAKAGRPLEVTSAYRSTSEQQYWYNGWVARKVGFNFALPPEKSDHVKGIAIDTPEYAWMEANANYFGWYRTDSRERWHYVYFPSRDQSLQVKPLEPVEEDDMYTDNDRYAAKLELEAAARMELSLYALTQQVKALAAKVGVPVVVDVDEQEIARNILAVLSPEAIAEAIPKQNAQEVADAILARVKARL